MIGNTACVVASIAGAGAMVPNRQPANNALKPTRSAFLPLGGPRGLVQCSAGSGWMAIT